ncbi:UDP-N-acetyl-alpha-D-glucosamine C6 dehydratase [Pantoea ananatis]|uniref:polysaccharide biosynthesis protein n=1 Tax=Pantoea ananas TaxID=553 RepID=UPI000D73B4FD|nr:nucleoside-diphosphate sugar epimerase/dehydratase [Pantoea ananatis]AWQ18183.1 nucleoside-diphosphate sugar epimerase [Pantoea ananatis]MCK0554204.1 polysaccharide biosynthesis protein [Pantoea ananatis]MCW0315859.1 UDP-N-acetyl-alpha-D-glucosamine C6 dehydratase [Pantoea ananatis]MCW0334000.1 UDP-N-acetyl-alpha-D-glucosamine C6 dehydratase [Pantoea ananatis]MCW0382178.1 UDP-N-acetyl-alpha-D-glucosamine C6 dehydratase [Pantoea ananatis]
MLIWFVSLPRVYKRIICLTIDIILLIFSFWLAFWLRIDALMPITSVNHWLLVMFNTLVTLLVFIKLGLYRAVLRYLSAKVFIAVTLGMVLSATLLVMLAFYTNIYLPRTIPAIYFAFGLLLIAGSRLLMRMLLNRAMNLGIKVIIYGAGPSGRQLLPALSQAAEYYPIAFVDENERLQNTIIHGVTVYSPEKLRWLVEKNDVKKILLAMPTASREHKREVISMLDGLTCEVLSIPSMVELVEGKATIDTIKKVSIADLLGRDPVAPLPMLISKNIKEKAVLVTGAGGSIGSELCRQIAINRPVTLVLYEISEFSLYAIEREISSLNEMQKLGIKVVPILGNVQEQAHLERVMKKFAIETVYHAAAYKHVPLVEYNVYDGVTNNIFGTLKCANAAINCGVKKFVLISTDKAVRPTNTMGASKRMAELVLQSLSVKQHDTCFCMVRFGNVLGSSGSVVPLFEKQIEAGGPITLTHPDIIRYFMTIPEAAQLVIQAGAMGKGGDVFVLDMGEPVKIMDLAHRMITLSGLRVKNTETGEGDIAIQITGLRPGEKLFEELLIGDNVGKTQHPRILTANEIMLDYDSLNNFLEQIQHACKSFDQAKIREVLIAAQTGFKPSDEMCDMLS